MYFNHVHSSLRSLCLPPSSQLVPSCCHTSFRGGPVGLIKVAYRTLGAELLTETWAIYQWLYNWGNCPSFPQQWLEGYKSPERGEPYELLSPPWNNAVESSLYRSGTGDYSCLEFGSVGSSKIKCSTELHLLPPALILFLPPLLPCFLSLGGGDRDVPLRAQFSLASCSLHFDQVFASSVTAARKKASTAKTDGVLNQMVIRHTWSKNWECTKVEKG